MFGKFWSKKEGDKADPRFPKPIEMPDRIGRYLVVNLKEDPDAVWNWKVATLPVEPPGKGNHVRVFSPEKAQQAGVAVKHFHTLDDHPHLILYSGTFDKKAGTVSLARPPQLEKAS